MMSSWKYTNQYGLYHNYILFWFIFRKYLYNDEIWSSMTLSNDRQINLSNEKQFIVVDYSNKVDVKKN